MSAIAASGVTFSVSGRSGAMSIDEDGTRYKKIKCVFGDGTSTYPSGGIPLSGLSSWGFPYTIGDVMIMDSSNGDGYIYKWDAVNNKIRIYYPVGTHTHDLKLVNAAVSDGSTTRVNAGTNAIGANTGSNITVAGASTSGGIQNNTAAVATEVTTAFVPASNVTLYLWVRGH
jgi:hypothetical protein